MTFPSTSDALDRLAPAHEFVPRWDDVLGRAEISTTLERRRTRRGRRRWLVAVALIVAIVVPLATLAASQNWWFLESGDAPTPLDGVTVVKTGVWDGKGWELTAYRSGLGLCFALTPTGSAAATGTGAGMSCGPVEGVPQPAGPQPTPAPAITFLAQAPSDQLPGHIVGPVTDKADKVTIYLAHGVTLTTPTFAAPSSLGSAIRFYATPIPASVQMGPSTSLEDLYLKKLVGLDQHNRIVACLTEPIVRGFPLCACR